MTHVVEKLKQPISIACLQFQNGHLKPVDRDKPDSYTAPTLQEGTLNLGTFNSTSWSSDTRTKV